MATTTQPPVDPHYDQVFWKERDERRNAARAKQARETEEYLENKKKEKEKAAQDERDREALALKIAIEKSVPLPVEYKILEPTNNGEKADRTAAEAKLKEMLEGRTTVKPSEIIINPDAASHGLKGHHGFYLLDMRNLNSNKLSGLPNVLSAGLGPFKSKYEELINPSKIVFIRVIRFSNGTVTLGGGSYEKVPTIMFNVYFPNADIVMCMRQVVDGGKQGYDDYAPTQCVFELPVDVFNYDDVRLYKPISRINPDDKGLLEDTITPNDVVVEQKPLTDTDTQSKIDKEGGIGALLDRFKGTGHVGGGKKLRSTKKTSKRRSVKSKPRYYRRSVGGINHRRKKTTRRRRR